MPSFQSSRTPLWLDRGMYMSPLLVNLHCVFFFDPVEEMAFCVAAFFPLGEVVELASWVVVDTGLWENEVGYVGDE